MSLQKAGGTNIDNTVTPAAATNLVDHLETHLVSAGWTIISGSGTDAIKFQSAATPDGMQIRILTGVSGSDMSLEMRNVGETATGTAGCIRLTVNGADSWRLMANKYGFVLFQDTTPVTFLTSGAKKWCICGTLYLESFLTPTVTEVGFLMGDHLSTGSSVHQRSFRNELSLAGRPAVFQGLYNGTLMEIHNDTSGSTTSTLMGSPALAFMSMLPSANQQFVSNPDMNLQWATGEFPVMDPLVMWGTPDKSTNLKRIRGQMFDVLVSMDPNLVRNDIVTIGLDSFRVINDPRTSDRFSYQDHACALLWLQP